MYPPVMARSGAPSAWSTSQSTHMVRSAELGRGPTTRAGDALSIAVSRGTTPDSAKRGFAHFLVSVALGIIAYSAVNPPGLFVLEELRDLVLISKAEHKTFVLPPLWRAEPSAYFM